MRRNTLIIILIILIVMAPSCKNKKQSDEVIGQRAQQICEKSLILDSHIDWPEYVLDKPEDISMQTVNGDFDLVRARKGGLDAVLSVVFISPEYETAKGRLMVDSMLKLIRHYPETYPDKFALAITPADVKKNFERKLFSLIPCLENGSPVGDDPGYLTYLKNQGIAYITLCHSKTNQISDSNFDADRRWNGLSPAGTGLIKEMNRLGIIIDISHSSDSTVSQAVRLSEAPIIASHSSCRYFVPGFERNLPDDLIKAIAEKRGVVMVNFCTQFLDSVCMNNTAEIQNLLNSKKLSYDSKEGSELIAEFGKTHRLICDSKQLVDHIEHIIEVAGIDYVGLGSDFDGVGPLKPSDVPDVSGYPVIVSELLRRGYSEIDIEKILSGNFLRVWDDVIAMAGSLNNSTGKEE
ncbi:MAG TPA: peptidase M19 [Bacteroidales bacterium]|nr:peptidase M19 [Bacteroidales bacterium]HBZ20421.1 peptidase M19 [Bacteroidales bacterium]